MSDNSNLELVVQQIEAAFAGVLLGDGVSLREADVIDNFGSPAQRRAARKQDELTDWRCIPDADLARYDWCLSFFDAQGLRFHLPAYLRFALRNYRTSSSASINGVIFRLRHDRDLELLNAAQRSAVRHFLKFMAHNTGNWVDSAAAKQALEHFGPGFASGAESRS